MSQVSQGAHGGSKQELFAAYCLAGLTDEVAAMLRDGVDVNHIDDQGVSGLILASIGGHLEIVDLLIAAGANVDHKSDVGNFPLGAATAMGHKAIVQRLVEAGADLNQQAPNGYRAIDLAWARDDYEIMEILGRAAQALAPEPKRKTNKLSELQRHLANACRSIQSVRRSMPYCS